MLERVTDAIRSRSRKEWEDYFNELLSRLREYSQTNGEKAAIVGFLLGMLVVIFYKLALIIACVTLVAFQLVLILSEDRSQSR
jgi:hypothetical protein